MLSSRVPENNVGSCDTNPILSCTKTETMVNTNSYPTCNTCAGGYVHVDEGNACYCKLINCEAYGDVHG